MSIIKSDNIPQAEYGIVGGSGTLSSDFPMNVRAEDLKVEEDGLHFPPLMGIALPSGFFPWAVKGY